MRLLAFGINHHTAPVEIREKAAFASDKLISALHDATADGGASEAAIVSTCNRTELYCGLESAR
ncbi:MAG: glutamyl-tRNA reductase, partial [Gammaproteobacteria bacterium]|nr:glutamyl-tRNA reductase [Gammaproteobacteria bacterium]